MAGDCVMCTCRPIDHAFDDDIDQYEVPGRQNSPPALTTPKEATERELLAYLAADKDEQEDK